MSIKKAVNNCIHGIINNKQIHDNGQKQMKQNTRARHSGNENGRPNAIRDNAQRITAHRVKTSCTPAH